MRQYQLHRPHQRAIPAAPPPESARRFDLHGRARRRQPFPLLRFLCHSETPSSHGAPLKSSQPWRTQSVRAASTLMSTQDVSKPERESANRPTFAAPFWRLINICALRSSCCLFPVCWRLPFFPILLAPRIAPASRSPRYRTARFGTITGSRPGKAATYKSDVVKSGPSTFTVTAWQLRDPTAALASFRLASVPRPPSRPSWLHSQAATRRGLLFAQGQYLIEFAGYQPAASELAAPASR